MIDDSGAEALLRLNRQVRQTIEAWSLRTPVDWMRNPIKLHEHDIDFLHKQIEVRHTAMLENNKIGLAHNRRDAISWQKLKIAGCVTRVDFKITEGMLLNEL